MNRHEGPVDRSPDPAPRTGISPGLSILLPVLLLVFFSLASLSARAELAPGRSGADDPISLHLKDAELADFFLTIRGLTGWNVVLGPDVRGKITLDLENVPLRKILAIVARQNDLSYEDDGRILIVETRTSTLRRAKEEHPEEEPAREYRPDQLRPVSRFATVELSLFETIEKRPLRLSGPASDAPVAVGLLDFSRRSSFELTWSRPYATRRVGATGRVRVSRLDDAGEGASPIIVVDFLDAAPSGRRLDCRRLPDGGGMTFGLEPTSQERLQQAAVARPQARDPFVPADAAKISVGRVEPPAYGPKQLRVSFRFTERAERGPSAVVTPVVDLADGSRGVVSFRLLGSAGARDGEVTLRFVVARAAGTFDLAGWIAPEPGTGWGSGAPESSRPFRSLTGLPPGEWRDIFPRAVSAGGRTFRVEAKIEEP